jgi:hypothetical protein
MLLRYLHLNCAAYSHLHVQSQSIPSLIVRKARIYVVLRTVSLLSSSGTDVFGIQGVEEIYVDVKPKVVTKASM